ncbi:L-Lactate Dehydrogenase A-Like 6B [Manis pentadactyla]|nr:L-Lactate Dehydrogenase A-Like 6B [Manis pentadactyla]
MKGSDADGGVETYELSAFHLERTWGSHSNLGTARVRLRSFVRIEGDSVLERWKTLWYQVLRGRPARNPPSSGFGFKRLFKSLLNIPRLKSVSLGTPSVVISKF